jgi:hypothetical protein
MDPDPGVTLDGGDHLGGSPSQFLTEALTVFSRNEHFQPEVRDEDQGARKQQKIIYRVKHRPTIMPFAGPVKGRLSTRCASMRLNLCNVLSDAGLRIEDRGTRFEDLILSLGPRSSDLEPPSWAVDIAQGLV